jgi:hypothetical protein
MRHGKQAPSRMATTMATSHRPCGLTKLYSSEWFKVAMAKPSHFGSKSVQSKAALDSCKRLLTILAIPPLLFLGIKLTQRGPWRVPHCTI